MKKIGVSLRQVARDWRCSAVYVLMFTRRFGLKPFADGSWDPILLTQIRAERTRVGSGQQRYLQLTNLKYQTVEKAEAPSLSPRGDIEGQVNG